MPLTPKRVNFSPLPSPRYVKTGGVFSPLPSDNCRPIMKGLLPRLSFKFRNNNSTADLEKAAMLTLGVRGSPSGMRNTKPPISGSYSLTKLFSSRIRSSLSLPVTPTTLSNPESMHGGNTTDPVSTAVSSQRTSIFLHSYYHYLSI